MDPALQRFADEEWRADAPRTLYWIAVPVSVVEMVRIGCSIIDPCADGAFSVPLGSAADPQGAITYYCTSWALTYDQAEMIRQGMSWGLGQGIVAYMEDCTELDAEHWIAAHGLARHRLTGTGLPGLE